jgi:hypothetical protein
MEKGRKRNIIKSLNKKEKKNEERKRKLKRADQKTKNAANLEKE